MLKNKRLLNDSLILEIEKSQNNFDLGSLFIFSILWYYVTKCFISIVVLKV